MTSDRRTILIEYRGTNPKLVSGHIYNRNDIAKAFGISRTTVANKLKGKTIMVDNDLILLQPQKYHKKSVPEKLMTYMGEETNGFKTYKKYTYKEISALSGIKINNLNKRIGTDLVFGAKQIRSKAVNQLVRTDGHRVTQFDSYAEVISANWLKRSILNA